MQYDIFLNPRAVAHIDGNELSGPQPIEYHRLLPGYEVTPLLDVPSIAGRLGVARVLVKDESVRLGLPSFKMLGASWATACAVRDQWLAGGSEIMSPAELSERIPDREGKRLVAATDGNHGRGVARMAKLLGVASTIFVPQGTSPSRIRDIEGEGANVRVVAGSYDDSIEISAAEADADTLVVSDTSWDGYVTIPAEVSRGYSTMFTEIDVALGSVNVGRPTVVAFQAGVGSFAAAGLLHFRSGQDRDVPRTLVVEPQSAACLQASARAGELTESPPPHNSTMAGLNCGLPSQLAWPVIDRTVDAFVAIDDDAAHEAMRVYAAAGIVAGESGAATLGALLAVRDAGGSEACKSVGLTRDAVVLLINTEGATDPVNFEAVVGESPLAVQDAIAARRLAGSVVEL